MNIISSPNEIKIFFAQWGKELPAQSNSKIFSIKPVAIENICKSTCKLGEAYISQQPIALMAAVSVYVHPSVRSVLITSDMFGTLVGIPLHHIMEDLYLLTAHYEGMMPTHYEIMEFLDGQG